MENKFIVKKEKEELNYKYEHVYNENGMTFEEAYLLMFKNWLRKIGYIK